MDDIFRGNYQSTSVFNVLIVDCQSVFREVGSCILWSTKYLLDLDLVNIRDRDSGCNNSVHDWKIRTVGIPWHTPNPDFVFGRLLMAAGRAVEPLSSSKFTSLLGHDINWQRDICIN